MFLPDWLRRSAESYPDRLALRCGPITWSFAELDREATRRARRLATAGGQAGARVAVLAQNGADYVVTVHALTRLGAVLVPLNTRLTLDEHCWQLADVRADLLVSDAAFGARAAEIRHRMPELPQATLADAAPEGVVALGVLAEDARPLRGEIDLSATQAIIYTSGTTGQPKGALITYGMQWWNAVASALNLGHDPQDRWLACLPFYHIGGLSILLRSVIYGIGVVALELEHFDAGAVNEAIVAEGVTIISVVAVMLQRMLAALDEGQTGHTYPPALRCVLLGGGPAPRPLLEDCAGRHIPVVQTYGLTESCSQAATLAPEDALRKLGSAGKPLLPVQLRIVDEEGGIAARGEPGGIELRGPTITPGYADRPDATAAAFHEGWLATGDVGYLDAEGYLYVLDRRVDLIISGGENVYPAEIEATLLAHPDVEEAGVCGVADARWGQAPVAFVRLRGGSTITRDDVLAYAAERLARYKAPKAVYIVAALPRTSSGKLMRRELASLLPDV